MTTSTSTMKNDHYFGLAALVSVTLLVPSLLVIKSVDPPDWVVTILTCISAVALAVVVTWSLSEIAIAAGEASGVLRGVFLATGLFVGFGLTAVVAVGLLHFLKGAPVQRILTVKWILDNWLLVGFYLIIPLIQEMAVIGVMLARHHRAVAEAKADAAAREAEQAQQAASEAAKNSNKIGPELVSAIKGLGSGAFVFPEIYKALLRSGVDASRQSARQALRALERSGVIRKVDVDRGRHKVAWTASMDNESNGDGDATATPTLI